MRVHQNIPGTVANWPLQTNFRDGGPNRLDLTPTDMHLYTPTTAPSFVRLSNRTSGTTVNTPCVYGVDMNNIPGVGLVNLNAAPLRFTGAFTVEWLMVQQQTFEWTYFTCSTLGSRSNPGAPGTRAAADTKGSLYTLWTFSGNPEFSDQFVGSNLPSPFYGLFSNTDSTLHDWGGTGTPTSGDWHVHHFAYTRDASGHWMVYRDGVALGAGIASVGTNLVSGNEMFIIGSTEGQYVFPSGDPAGGVMATARFLNYARSAADILADANDAFASCLPTSGTFTVSDGRFFVVGGTYQSQSLGMPDLGTVTVTAVNGNHITGTYNDNFVPQVGHIFQLISQGRGFSLELVSLTVGLYGGQNRLPDNRRV